MIAATNSEMAAAIAFYSELRCDGTNLAFADAQLPSIRIDLREVVDEPHQLVFLARLIAALGYDETDLHQAFLWITDWGIWNSRTEAIGVKTLEQIRRSFGENRSLEAAPGHIFRQDEFTESVCCLLQPMLIGWDAYYVPTSTSEYLDYFVAVSHDSVIDINVRTQEMHDKAIKVLNESGIKIDGDT